METAIIVRTGGSDLELQQAAWDMFLADALLDFDNPNPDLCHDLALDKTVRALGQRPQPALTRVEREELAIRVEVEALIAERGRIRNIGTQKRNNQRQRADEADEAREARFEALVDDACEGTDQ